MAILNLVSLRFYRRAIGCVCDEHAFGAVPGQPCCVIDEPLVSHVKLLEDTAMQTLAAAEQSLTAGVVSQCYGYVHHLNDLDKAAGQTPV
ncbi:hypothetical protein K239x_12040 [Planctomycetes bacterium K23_9]|uniref:Uncharacterized protein n=1 Tax=Stieleria marina TaxID=1930275 RepID=A0A517NQ61_9BACT|nr:hypothetical protein K239x_12040 [Planctomycetes bacterium K23_9]